MAADKTTGRTGLAEANAPEPAVDPGMPRDGRRRLQRISSTTLLQGERRIIIEHEGSDYLLQLTGKGKLILTK
jgi:hemin uptake protein HemP